MVSCGAVPAVRRGPGFSRDCRSARAAQWARQAHGHRAGARGAVDARLGRRVGTGQSSVGAMRMATVRLCRRGQNYSLKRASIAATRSFRASISRWFTSSIFCKSAGEAFSTW